MTNWKFVEPGDEEAKTTLVSVYSEEMIIKEYFRYWSEQMKRVGKSHLISEKNCIEDWVIINWASKTDEPVGMYYITGE